MAETDDRATELSGKTRGGTPPSGDAPGAVWANVPRRPLSTGRGYKGDVQARQPNGWRIAGHVIVLVGVVPIVVHSVLRLTGSGGHIALLVAGAVLVLVGLLLRRAART